MNLLTKKSIKRFITFNYNLSRFKKDNIGIKENFVFPFVYIFKNHKIVSYSQYNMINPLTFALLVIIWN